MSNAKEIYGHNLIGSGNTNSQHMNFMVNFGMSYGDLAYNTWLIQKTNMLTWFIFTIYGHMVNSHIIHG